MTVTEVVLDKVVVHPLVLLSVVDHFSRLTWPFKHIALLFWIFFAQFGPILYFSLFLYL